MKSKAEQIYEAIGAGYGYNGSKEQCIEIIENILNSDIPASKNFIKPDVIKSVCECVYEYNDDHHPLLVWQCPKCEQDEKQTDL